MRNSKFSEVRWPVRDPDEVEFNRCVSRVAKGPEEMESAIFNIKSTQVPVSDLRRRDELQVSIPYILKAVQRPGQRGQESSF